MIPHGVEIFVNLEPIDLRWSFDRLAGLVAEHLGHHARSGALFVFFGRRREALKVLFYDGTGLCQFYKRLDRGTFRLPEALSPGQRTVTLEEHALEALLDGIEVQAPAPRRVRRRLH
jgi:transposase